MGPTQCYDYDIFKTRWGWFGVIGNVNGLLRTHLPAAHKEAVQSRLLSGIGEAKRDKNRFSELKTVIQSYYEGRPLDFKDVKVCLDELTEFQQKVLITLRKVKYGTTITYGELARLSGTPRGGRAIGTVMAANPLPLIIPCHRVIKADGSCGHFSAPGGTDTKKRMLNLEKMVHPLNTY